MNIGLRHQNRIVLQADNQIPVLLEGLPEGIASLEDTVCNVDLEGFRVWVNSFGNEVIVETCLLGIVFVNIDLGKLAASTNLDNARAGVDKPLFALSVAFLDDPVKIIDGVRPILHRQGSPPLVGGQTFLQGKLGIFLPSLGTRQQSAIYCFRLQGTIQGELAGSERLGCTQKFLRFAESKSEQQSSSFMCECFSHAERQVRQTIHLRPQWEWGMEICAA